LISWEGRGDNIKISEAIDNLSQPVLIWIEGPKIIKDDQYVANPDPTYVILDGTWQEAKKMFRQGPECLRYCCHIFYIIFHILYQDIHTFVHIHMNICMHTYIYMYTYVYILMYEFISSNHHHSHNLIFMYMCICMQFISGLFLVCP
jgi:hypothetical protein